MIIQHNMQAMNANRMLGKIVTSQSKSTEKLSSGYQINRAADNAAGLAISEKMRGQIRGLNRASENAQDGISLIQTAEGALNESQSILQRMRELSVQAANETNTESDRENIQLEINQLTSEINRIGNTTEFNTKSLLKGNTTDAVTSDTGVETVVAGEKAETVGVASNFKVIKESVTAEASTVELKAGSADTTGKASDITVKKEGIKAEKASATLLGLKFEYNTAGTGGNGVQVELKASSTATASKADYTSGKLTITLSEADINAITTVSDFNTKIGELLADSSNSSNGGTTGAITAVKVVIPEGADSATDISSSLQALLKDTSAKEEATLTGGTKAQAGVYTFDLEEAFSEAGDTITIAGYTFTAEDVAATASSNSDGKFRLGATAKDKDIQGTDIAAELESKLNSSNVYGTGAVSVSYSNGKITITESSGFEGKIALDKTVTTAGAGEDEILTITDELGQNIQVKLVAAANASTALKAEYTKASGTDSTGLITITLSDVAANNSAEKIQAAIRGMTDADLATDKVNVSKFVVTGNDGWDSVALKATLNKGWATMTGGTMEVKGEYSFNLSKTLAAGETLTIAGQTFTAVEKNADASKGEFAIGSDMTEQINNLMNAMRNNEVTGNYNITADGAVIKLTEKKASGTDFDGKDLTVTASGVAGQYKVDTSELLKDGASITIDGEEIVVSSKNAHSGYADGTAIKEAETAEGQAQALADAINKNAALSAKYNATVDGEQLVLTQKTGNEEGPSVSTTSSTKGNLEIKLQIGANTGQSMTVEIGDARSLALGVSGDGSTSDITASDGSVAVYTQTATVNNGSDNNNVEYALDVSTFDNASAATAVIDDALNALSKQRAELGAYQNRLEYTITNLDNTSENVQSAESNIRDVDMAEEMVTYSKNSILQQAAQSMLAQANQSTQGVLSLLQ